MEPQKPMREMLPDFLAARVAFMASKCLLDAKDHLRVRTSAPPTKLGEQPLPPPIQAPASAQLSDPSQKFGPLFSLFNLSLL